MTKDEAIALGFESLHELIVYYDVCLDLCRFDDYINNNLKNKNNYTKSECIDTINQYNLMDLLNDVKYKSIYDRLVTIFLHYYNSLQIYNSAVLLFITKLNESIRLYDGDSMDKYLEKIKECTLNIAKIKYFLDEFMKRIGNRLTGNNMINFKVLLRDVGYDNDKGFKL